MDGRLMRFFMVLLALCLLSGCNGRPGKSESTFIKTQANGQTDAQPTKISVNGVSVDIPAGYDVTVSTAKAVQPTPPDEPAKTKTDDRGAESDSGNAGSGGAVPGLAGSFWVGICLIIVGGILFLSKRASWARFIAPGPTALLFKIGASLPPGTGVLIAGLGVGLLFAPWFLTTIEPLVIPLTLICAGLAIWWVVNFINNKNKDRPDSVVAKEALEVKPPVTDLPVS